MEAGEEKKESRLSKEQKIGFVLLLAFAILVVGLGVLQIRNNMYGHFALNNSIPATLKDQVDTVDALRFRDTDKDTLTDFDELYIYGTSQYIADTDSDGIDDGEEVKSGINPLCAEGTSNCELSPESVAIAINTSTGDIAGSDLEVPAGQMALDLEEAIKDPVQIRQMLLSAGIEQEILNQISDIELMAMITEMMSSSSTINNIQNLNSGLNTSATQ